jgi:uncharacterized protein YbaR (Trm112 family)
MGSKKLKVLVKYDKNEYDENENKFINEQLKRIKKINDKIPFVMNIKVQTNTLVKIEQGPFYLTI